MANFWHYTTKDRLDDIINSGELKVSKANGTNPSERGTLWFSKNPNWEPTATKMAMTPSGIKQLSKKEQYELFGLGRIQISDNVKLYNWKQFKEFGGGKLKLLRKMEESGIRMGGNPSFWYWTWENIPKEEWIKIEYFNGSEWVKY